MPWRGWRVTVFDTVRSDSSTIFILLFACSHDLVFFYIASLRSTQHSVARDFGMDIGPCGDPDLWQRRGVERIASGITCASSQLRDSSIRVVRLLSIPYAGRLLYAVLSRESTRLAGVLVAL